VRRPPYEAPVPARSSSGGSGGGDDVDVPSFLR
jgi:hypothetical protein